MLVSHSETPFALPSSCRMPLCTCFRLSIFQCLVNVYLPEACFAQNIFLQCNLCQKSKSQRLRCPHPPAQLVSSLTYSIPTSSQLTSTFSSTNSAESIAHISSTLSSTASAVCTFAALLSCPIIRFQRDKQQHDHISLQGNTLYNSDSSYSTTIAYSSTTPSPPASVFYVHILQHK